MNDKCKHEHLLRELTKIYPQVVSIVDSWQTMAFVHGDRNTPQDEKILKKYGEILQQLGILQEIPNKENEKE